MRSIFTVLCLMLISVTVSAAVHIKAKVNVSAESHDVDIKQLEGEGWIVFKDDYDEDIFLLDIEISSTDLPLEKNVGPVYLSVSQSGVVRLGASIGDDDAGADTVVRLPSKDGLVLPIEKVVFESSGGDYASGAWSYSASLELTIKH